MKIVLNGEAMEVPEGLTVQGLIERLELTAPRLAVEMDRALVPRSAFATHRLADGAAIEIVTFVGGG